MATIAKWGNRTWEVSAKQVKTLEGLSLSYAQVADNNTSTEEAKPTNTRGRELVTLTFNTVLHSGAGVDIRKEIETWEKYVTYVNYFYLGGKNLGPKFQLRKVTVNDVKLDDLGRMRLATLSFEFKEYDPETTSVKRLHDTSGLSVTASANAKNQKKNTNQNLKSAKTTTLKVGAYVKPTGKKYVTGEKIPDWVKQRSHVVSQIKGNTLLLGSPNGINSWVYKNEVKLVVNGALTIKE